MAPTQPPSTPFEDAWLSPTVAQRYANAENGSRPFAKILVKYSGLENLDEDVQVFDLATGTGAVIKELYDAVPQGKWNKLDVLGGDVSESMLKYLEHRGKEEGWTGLRTEIMDGNQNMSLPPSSKTHIFTSFAIFVVPGCLPQLHTILKPGGWIGLTTWTHLPWQALVSSAISKMPSSNTSSTNTNDIPYNPTATDFANKLFSNRPWGSPSYVAEQLRSAGFQSVQTAVHKARASVENVGIFMETMQIPLTIVQGFWAEDKRGEWGAELNEALRREVVEMVGGEHEKIEMEFEAVVAWGSKGEMEVKEGHF